jgi:hypothetical protein
MFVRVKFLVNRRILQPKVRAQVNHLRSMLQERNRILSRHPMRQREKDNQILRFIGDQRHTRFSEAQRLRLRIM